MTVSKKYLEDQRTEDLEKYIQPGNRFVANASMFAFEILQDRGRIFTEDERRQILAEIDTKRKEEEYTIHPNFKKAADFIYLSAALGLGNLIWTIDTIDDNIKLSVAILVILSVFGVGYIVGKGIEWIKYIYLFLCLVGLIAIPVILLNLQHNTVVGVINIIQLILQFWALILLFKVPNDNKL